MVGRDTNGRPVILETYRLAGSEKAFWQAACTPRTTAALHDERFTEYLKRVLLHAAMILSLQPALDVNYSAVKGATQCIHA